MWFFSSVLLASFSLQIYSGQSFFQLLIMILYPFTNVRHSFLCTCGIILGFVKNISFRSGNIFSLIQISKVAPFISCNNRKLMPLCILKVHRKSAHLSSCMHHNKRTSFVDRGKILIATFLCLNVKWSALSVSPSLGKRHLDPIHEIASSDVDIWTLKLLSQSFPLKNLLLWHILHLKPPCLQESLNSYKCIFPRSVFQFFFIV